MRFGISSLVTLAVIARSAAEPTRSINPPLSVVRDVDLANLPPAPEPATNGERFAQGLPPMKPRSRKHRTGSHRDVVHPEQGTRVASAPRSETSPSPPVQKRCKLAVKAYRNSSVYGYVGSTLNDFGEYGLQDTQDAALVVSFTYSSGSSSLLDFRAENGPTKAYPYVGGAVSYSSSDNNIARGSPNYAYIVGTMQTLTGPAKAGENTFSTATGIPADYESAIWTYDPDTNDIDVQWINSDGSAPATGVLYADDGNDAFLITASGNQLPNTGGMNYPRVSFACVEVDSA